MALRLLIARLYRPCQQIIQRCTGLQIAQPRGVGRGNIDGEIIAQTIERGDAFDIVLGLVSRVLVSTHVQAHNAALLGQGLQPRLCSIQALIVKAQTVDHRPLGDQAKHPRLGVARLRQRGDGARLRKAKTSAQKRGDDFGVFVKSCRHTNRVFEGKPHHRGSQCGAVCRANRGKASFQRLDRHPMGFFRVHSHQ